MTKLTQIERQEFRDILQQDLNSIDQKLIEQIRMFWNKARIEVMKNKGWDKLIKEKDKLFEQQEIITKKIHEIEETMRKESLTPQQIVELGGEASEYGRYKGANFYGIPVESQFEYEVVEFIRRYIDLSLPAKIIRDICNASIRELAMSGTFEEAREAYTKFYSLDFRKYTKFYSLDFRKYGVDIPPRLGDIKNSSILLEQAHQTLSLGNKKELYLDYKKEDKMLKSGD